MVKWDDFVSISQFVSFGSAFNNSNLPMFRKNDNEDNCLLHKIFQIVDILTLTINSAKYKERCLVLAVMYLNIGLCISAFTLEKMVKNFPLHTQVLTQYSEYNSLFREFMISQIGLDFCDILEAIQYVSRFFTLTFDYSSMCNITEGVENYVILIFKLRIKRNFCRFRDLTQTL